MAENGAQQIVSDARTLCEILRSEASAPHIALMLAAASLLSEAAGTIERLCEPGSLASTEVLLLREERDTLRSDVAYLVDTDETLRAEITRLRAAIDSARNTCSRSGGCIPAVES